MSIDDPLKPLAEIFHPDARRPNLIGTLHDEHADLASIRLNHGAPEIAAQLFETADSSA